MVSSFRLALWLSKVTSLALQGHLSGSLRSAQIDPNYKGVIKKILKFKVFLCDVVRFLLKGMGFIKTRRSRPIVRDLAH